MLRIFLILFYFFFSCNFNFAQEKDPLAIEEIVVNADYRSSDLNDIPSSVIVLDESLIQNVVTFDIYEGENIPKDKKSVAINVTLQAVDKTLTENDLDEISKKIIDTVSKKTGATIRS